ncbi:SID1 transmembrane family member 1-like [Maniola jurtina]|uniref:SID1 transmembrane family member 1-like n=1 Tax=Maniola jurtina TaxID=191418 RepID=UPI001E68796B|nr:SID1 transmembrane family member 1-like [Maniola jurtina]
MVTLCARVVFLWMGCVFASQPVTVVQLQLAYNEVHTLLLNHTVEYILEFTPPAGGVGSYDNMPSLVWLHSDGGDIAHPVLVTARQRAGAVTWQLPYELQARLLFELERTLCPDDTADAGGATSDCEGEKARSAFSVHVSTACVAPLHVTVRVSRPAVWRLPFGDPVSVYATESEPRVSYYAFDGEQRSVRLVVSSESEACAMLSVQNYSCPIVQTLTDVETVGQRLTMIHSGAVQIMRSEFPRGFFVVALVFPTDESCRGAEPHDDDWLWGDAMLRSEVPRTAPPPRKKDFAIAIGAALTREQYAVASVVTLVVFLCFYVLFGALVLAQRWPPFARHVLPRAVLAPQPEPDASAAEQATGPASPRRRRGSNDTYDSCDDSNSDEEYDAVPTNQSSPSNQAASPPWRNGDLVDARPDSSTAADGQEVQSQHNGSQGPFGLPAAPCVAELARRPPRTLRARSDRYLHTLYTVAVFYALPVVQFVIAFQIFLNVSGSLDYCYYNFLCAHRAGALSDFNHVISNLGYLLLGALFMLQVRRRRMRRKRQPRHLEYGIPAHYGLLSALGAGMMVVAVLSASYHVCPNRLNFQFDTAFMYVLAALIMVKIYQARHPDINARAHASFAVLAVIIATVVWGVLGGGRAFWGVFTAAHVFTFLLLSLHIYYFGQFRLEKSSLVLAASELRKGARPMYRARLIMLIVGNALNWMLAAYGLLQQSGDFAGHMLVVLLGNALLYMLFYLGMKLAHGERLRWYAWALLAGAAAAWLPALYFFLSGSSDWSTTPALSRHRNHDCKVMQFYDSHDLWHMLSAVALYLSFSALLTWDDGLSAVKRTDIPVF